jgi:hypothetical protein
MNYFTTENLIADIQKSVNSVENGRPGNSVISLLIGGIDLPGLSR